MREGLLFETRINTKSAATLTNAARKVTSDVNISEAVTRDATLPAPASSPWAAPRLPNPRHRRWAIPTALLGLSIGATFLGSSVVFVDRYAEAPGSASAVEQRMEFEAVKRYPAKGSVLFVTVAGPHLTGLQALVGWLDPDVDELTFAQKFGTSTPEQERSRGLKDMRSAKDDAPYVALTKLGYPTERIPGKVVVSRVLCLEASKDRQTCLKYVPADAFLDDGDEILSIGGKAITTRDDISAALAGHRAGDKVSFTVRRAGPTDDQPGPEQTGDVELVANPDDATKPFIGIELADTTQVKLPFTVNIDTGAIGGPSAGLAFTLTLLDELTPGELTGGKKVAVTGTIDLDGRVGAIGGIRQKAVAVKQAGAQLFIVPASQSDEDLAAVRKTLGADRVVAVSTLDEALAALAKIGGNALELGTPGSTYTG